MSSVKIGSSPAPAPKTSRPSAESKPAAARSSEPSSSATRLPGSRDEFTRPAGGSKPGVQGAPKAQETTFTLPKELEPFREQLDSLAKKIASDPELVQDNAKRMEAIIKGVKEIPGIPKGNFWDAVKYVDLQSKGYSGGKEKFG